MKARVYGIAARVTRKSCLDTGRSRAHVDIRRGGGNRVCAGYIGIVYGFGLEGKEVRPPVFAGLEKPETVKVSNGSHPTAGRFTEQHFRVNLSGGLRRFSPEAIIQ
jgi:hypothetical protein